MANTIGILLFEGVEEIDFVGPWQLFTAAAMGMRVVADCSYADVSALDVLRATRSYIAYDHPPRERSEAR